MGLILAPFKINTHLLWNEEHFQCIASALLLVQHRSGSPLVVVHQRLLAILQASLGDDSEPIQQHLSDTNVNWLLLLRELESKICNIHSSNIKTKKEWNSLRDETSKRQYTTISIKTQYKTALFQLLSASEARWVDYCHLVAQLRNNHPWQGPATRNHAMLTHAINIHSTTYELLLNAP